MSSNPDKCIYCLTIIDKNNEHQILSNTINSIIHNISYDISNIISQYSYQSYCGLCPVNMCVKCRNQHYDATICAKYTLCKYVYTYIHTHCTMLYIKY